MPTNRDGIVIKQGGALTTTSAHSALSGERLDGAAVTLPVRGVPGLYVRLGPSEARQLTEAQRQQVEARARAWAARFGKIANFANLDEAMEAAPDDGAGKFATVANLDEVIDGAESDPESEEQQHDQSSEV